MCVWSLTVRHCSLHLCFKSSHLSFSTFNSESDEATVSPVPSSDLNLEFYLILICAVAGLSAILVVVLFIFGMCCLCAAQGYVNIVQVTSCCVKVSLSHLSLSLPLIQEKEKEEEIPGKQ